MELKPNRSKDGLVGSRIKKRIHFIPFYYTMTFINKCSNHILLYFLEKQSISPHIKKHLWAGKNVPTFSKFSGFESLFKWIELSPLPKNSPASFILSSILISNQNSTTLTRNDEWRLEKKYTGSGYWNCSSYFMLIRVGISCCFVFCC